MSARRLPLIAFVGYVLLVVYQSLVSGGAWQCGGAVLGTSVRLSRTDLLANVVAYVPLGLLVAMVVPPPGGRAGRRVLWFLAGASSVAALSLTLELAQSCQSSRVSSACDLAANAAGGVLGLGAGVVVAAVRSHHGMRPSTPGAHADAWLRLMTLAVGAAWVVSQTMPWVFAVDVGTIRSNLSFLRHWGDAPLDPWRIARHAGAWAAIACASRLAFPDVSRACGALLLTVAAGLGLQLLLDARAPLSFEEGIGLATAVMVVVPLMARDGKAHSMGWALGLFCGAFVSVAAYELRPDPQASASTQVFSVWPRVGLGGLKGAIDYALLFGWFGLTAVVAAQWAARGGRPRARLVWPALAVLAMLSFEVAQTRVPGRGPDISAPLFTLLAVLTADAIVRRPTASRP